MNMKRIITMVITLCLAILTFSRGALAETNNRVSVCADSVIISADVSLNVNGLAYFNVTVFDEAASIRVSLCKLQQLVNGKWVNVRNLAVPSYVATNDSVYTATKDYSDYCTSGHSYRLVATYNIDGYTKTYTSNTATY